MSLTIHQIAVEGFDQNFSYIIIDTVTRQAYVVDPNGDFLKVAALIDTHGYKVVGIVLTHTHFDHLDKLSIASDEYRAPIYVYETGVPEIAKFREVHALTDGMKLPLGTGSIEVMYTPGHTDDSVCLFIPTEHAEDGVPKVITGDTLFVGGCGRTNELRVKDLYESLAELAHLPDNTEVFPGHDYGDSPSSTIGHEKVFNKYYQVENFNEFVKLRLG